MMAVDDATRLRRFCYLGSFDTVYVHSGPAPIDGKKYYSPLQEYCLNVDGATIVKLLTDAMPRAKRKDEAVLVYVVYLSTQPSDCRTIARDAFPTIIKSDEDLFMFSMYAIQIRTLENKKTFSRTVAKAIDSWYAAQTAEGLREFWLNHRGQHGFTHENLIRMVHVKRETFSDSETADLFFKKCREVVEEAVPSKRPKKDGEPDTADDATVTVQFNANASHEHDATAATKAHSSRRKSAPTPRILAMHKLRLTKCKKTALQIIKKYDFRYHQVPSHFKNKSLILQAVVPSMPYMTILKNWKKYCSSGQFDNREFFHLCFERLENRQLLQAADISPIFFLMQMYKFKFEGDLTKLPPSRLELFKLPYYHQLFEDSFGANRPTGLRIHITINLQANYRKKPLRHCKTLSYLEAAVVLAFSYFKAEESVDVFYWDEDLVKLTPLEWNRTMNIRDAMSSCDDYNLFAGKNKQRLILPVLNSMKTEPYDMFLSIVPGAGRGNPSNSSGFLCKFLDKYSSLKKTSTRYVIVNLLKYHKSMYYSTERTENILEICGLDENTPKLINEFGLHSFS